MGLPDFVFENETAILCCLAEYCIATGKWKWNARPTTLINMDMHLLPFSPDIHTVLKSPDTEIEVKNLYMSNFSVNFIRYKMIFGLGSDKLRVPNGPSQQ